jgi:hypothetical protein
MRVGNRIVLFGYRNFCAWYRPPECDDGAPCENWPLMSAARPDCAKRQHWFRDPPQAAPGTGGGHSRGSICRRHGFCSSQCFDHARGWQRQNARKELARIRKYLERIRRRSNSDPLPLGDFENIEKALMAGFNARHGRNLTESTKLI